MVEIRNAQVYNLREAVLASGNAMRLEPIMNNLDYKDFDAVFNSSLERCERLAKLGGGTGHSNFRTGILVTFDLKYPQYITKQVQRYHFLQYVSSTSMMHCITKMDFSKCCNRYVSATEIELMNSMIQLYNLMFANRDQFEVFSDLRKDYYVLLEQYFSERDAQYSLGLNTPDDVLYDLYMRIISNCPMGAELWVHCSTNYEQLATIYKQRKNHKLKEDWGEFCAWIESLPYAKDLICCGQINDEH